jgi:hypothetical protein
MQTIGRLEMQYRVRYEFRLVGSEQGITECADVFRLADSHRQGHLRYQLNAEFPLNTREMEDGTIYSTLSNEIFINTGQQIASHKLLDQNRAYAGLGYQVSKIVSLEAGYLKQLVFRFNNAAGSNIDDHNIVQVSLSLNNFGEFLKPKNQAIPE